MDRQANMNLIEPGDRLNSYLFRRIVGDLGGSRMPQGGPYLGAEATERLGLWVDRL